MRRMKFLFIVGMLIAGILAFVGGLLISTGYRNFDMLSDPNAQPGQTRPFWERFLEDFDWNTFDFDNFDWDTFRDDFPWEDLPWDDVPDHYDWNRLPWDELNDTFPWGNVQWDDLPEDFDWGDMPWGDIPEDFDWGSVPWGDVPIEDLPEDFPWENVPWDNLPEDFDWGSVPWGDVPIEDLPEDFPWENVPWEDLPADFDWGNVPWDNLPEDFDWGSIPWENVPFDQLPADFPWEKVPWGDLAEDFDWGSVPWDSLPGDFDWGSLPWEYLIPLAALGMLDMPWDRIPHDAIPDGLLPDDFSPWADECEHVFGPYEIVKDATCGEPGLKRHVCTLCKLAETEVIDPTGEHEFNAEHICNTCNRRLLIVNGSADTKEKEYDGTPLSDNYYEIDWANSAAPVPGHNIIVTNLTSITEVGTAVNRFSVIVRDGTNENMRVDDAYVIIKNYNRLVVKRRVITIVTESAEKVYDGTPLTCPQYRVEGDLVPGDELIDVVFDEEGQKEYGNKPNTIVSYRIVNSAGEDVMRNYEVRVQCGTLTVKRK